jgi:hypothetical protein
VPDEVVSIAQDKDLFTNPADITTKEILKRYGEVRRSTGGQLSNANNDKYADSTPVRSQESNGGNRSGAPILTRVATDPSQTTAWQKESSVRHVQQPNGGPSYSPSNQNTPPPHNFEFANPNGHFHGRKGSADSAESYGTPNQQSHRQSGWGKNNSQGQMGVTGAS